MKKPKAIHFVGIKGVGMTPLALIAQEAGIRVTGSDIADEFITDVVLKKKGIVPLIGFSKDHIGQVDVVIFTGAHQGLDNIEVQEAKKKNIPVITQGEAVGLFMKGEMLGKKNMVGVSVSGSHGKTTTTAMAATILKEAKKDPSFVIGTGEIPSLGACGHFGKGNYFIAEADEYATEPTYDLTPKFLWQYPKIAIITNIELDHPDLYDSMEKIQKAFSEFIKHVENDGILIVNGHDLAVAHILKQYKGRVITFGHASNVDYIIKRVSISGDHTFFWLDSYNTQLGEFMLNVSGEYNVFNAVGAMIAALEVGIPIEVIQKALPQFTGTKRRSEYIGMLAQGALLFDDYAHHPTEIKNTLHAFRKRFPKSKIVCIFQPHTYSRTKKFYAEFVRSFADADEVILMDIYPSLRESIDMSVSSRLLCEDIKKIHANTHYLSALSDVIEYIDKKAYPAGTIVLTMGAGDVYKIREKLAIITEKS